jgi:hypothetical protein
MNPDDVERHLLNHSRATMLAAKRVFETIKGRDPNALALLVPPIEAATKPISAGSRGVDADGAKFRALLADANDHELSILLGSSGHMIKLPYALVRAAWVTTDGRPGFALAVRIVVIANGPYFLEHIS